MHETVKQNLNVFAIKLRTFSLVLFRLLFSALSLLVGWSNIVGTASSLRTGLTAL